MIAAFNATRRELELANEQLEKVEAELKKVKGDTRLSEQTILLYQQRLRTQRLSGEKTLKTPKTPKTPTPKQGMRNRRAQTDDTVNWKTHSELALENTRLKETIAKQRQQLQELYAVSHPGSPCPMQ